MGWMRFLLSLLVVGSHVGGMGGTPAGATAIAGFFTISGFLMARTLDENYRGQGVLRFYLNRVLRIGPPFVAVLALTWVALWARDARPFQSHLEFGVPTGAYMPVELPPSPLRQLALEPQGYPLFLYPSFRLLPQAWSLVTESAFYLAAPWLLWTFRGGAFRWRWVLPVVSLWLAVAGYDRNWLRSPAAALWVFWLGMQAYCARAGSALPPTGARRLGELGPAVAVMAIGCGLVPLSGELASFVVPPLMVAFLVLGGWDRRQSLGLERFVGNLAYGVFLGHFLSTITMYWIAESVFARTGRFGIFGIPDVTEWRLRVSSFAFAIVAGALVHLAFERPFERVRARVRRPGPAAPSI